MTIIEIGERYTPLFPFSLELKGEQRFLCFDVAKSNLFWLIEPRIDTEGVDAALDNQAARDIDEFMDGATRKMLQGLPLPFLSYWDQLDDGELALAQHWPMGYRATMAQRAADAHRRLLGVVEDGNVVKVNFRRAA